MENLPVKLVEGVAGSLCPLIIGRKAKKESSNILQFFGGRLVAIAFSLLN